VGQLIAAGATVAVQAGAGVAAGLPDAAYVEATAEIASDRAKLIGSADVVVVVRRPATEELVQRQ
jgi:NAD(P) transhydrogenase subunit alpha